MAKYRIIEVQRKCGNINYTIQKMGWFIWLDLDKEYMDTCSPLFRGEYKTFEEAKNKLNTTFKCKFSEKTIYEIKI